MTRVGGMEAMHILEERYQHHFGNDEEAFSVIEEEDTVKPDTLIDDYDAKVAMLVSMQLHRRSL